MNFRFPDMNPTEIRLLRVLSARHFDEDIECDMVTRAQDTANYDYEALSYVWGSTDESNLLPIIVNSQTFYVTSNLESALRHLRYKNHDRTLWVDAICLDQNDFKEKTRVVPEMHQIYRSAERVLAWIGKTIPDTEAGLDILSSLSEILTEFTDLNVRGMSNEDGGINMARLDEFVLFIDSKLKDDQLPEADDLRWQELEKLFSCDWWDDWWDRVWTLQEAVSAKTYNLIWGQRMVSDVTFNNAAEMMRTMSSRGLLSPAKLPRTLLVSRKQMDTEKLRKMLKEEGSVSLATALAASQLRSATDPRDHLYGCLGLAGKQRLTRTIDYTKEVSTVFEDATRALIEESVYQGDGLNFLTSCCMTRKREFDPMMPSWTLLFDRKMGHAAFCLPFGAHWDFDASGKQPAVASFTEQNTFDGTSVLVVRGILVDGIECVGRRVVPSDISQMDDEEGNKVMADFYNECWTNILQASLPHILPKEQSPHKSLFRTLVGDLEAALDSDQAVRLNYMSAAKSACFGRKFFVTSSHIGLAPQEADIGDKIFIVAGCDVPLILRRIATKSALSRGHNGHEIPSCFTETQHQEDSSVRPEGSRYEIVGNACKNSLTLHNTSTFGDEMLTYQMCMGSCMVKV